MGEARRAPTVGVSVDWISGAYARMVLGAILQAAKRRGVNVICLDDGVRIWDALDPPYRLSVSYIARLVRLDPDTQRQARPVVTTRFAYGEEVQA